MRSSKWHGPDDIRQTLIRPQALEFMGEQIYAGTNISSYKHKLHCMEDENI